MKALEFHGVLSLPWAVGLGLLAAGAALVLYWWRDTREQRWFLRWSMPLLRALVVLLLFLMLTGPMLHYRQEIGESGRILVFLDASLSMKTTDEQMETGRKLQIAEQRGWLPAKGWDTSLVKAGERLEKARAAVKEALESNAGGQNLRAAAKTLAGELTAVGDLIRAATPPRAPAPGVTPGVAPEGVDSPAALYQQFKREMIDPAAAAAVMPDNARQTGVRAALAGLVPVAGRWEQTLDMAFDAYARGLAASGDTQIAQALKKFDAAGRWSRVQAMLLTGQEPLLEKLAENNQVEVFALVNNEARRLWTQTDQSLLPTRFEVNPDGTLTNLSDPLRTQVGTGEKDQERTAVVLLSDGAQNAGGPAADAARVLSARKIPIYAVCVGSPLLPKDLAITRIDQPTGVFYKDRVKGRVTLKDDMPPGLPITLKIECNGKTLWEKQLNTDRSHLRKFDYDFSVEEVAAQAIGGADKLAGVGSQPINLPIKVSVTVLEDEKDKDNNAADVNLAAIVNKRKVLLLDGRPRWEFRYIRTAFERDDQWETNSLVWGVDNAGASWPRGDKPGTFPKDLPTLMTYDMIVFGEVPPGLLKEEELDWIKAFVDLRGGGVVFIDGRRGMLRRYEKTPLGVLLPIKWEGDQPVENHPTRLHLTEEGARFAPLQLTKDQDENRQLWESFQAPHWVAQTTALPGTEIYMEAVVGARTWPALVRRSYGSGKVLYAAFDESWRLRFGVADKYHPAYWKQVGNWIMEHPFPVHDKYVWLDTGPANYNPGDEVAIRVRIRDELGRAMTAAEAQAIIYRDGKQVASVKLEADADEGGLFHAKTSPLGGGRYEVGVLVKGLPEAEMKARTKFTIQAQEIGELARLNADEDLLREMADDSSGEFLREEQAGALIGRLSPLNQKKVLESEVTLWNNWHWFIPLVFLLTVEWVLRKRAGML